MRRALVTLSLLAVILASPSGSPLAVRAAGATAAFSPSQPGVTWAVKGDRSYVYARTPSGGRLQVADEPFDRLILPQFSVFITRSPDGRQITYVTADDEGLANAHLWLVNADGSGRRLLGAFDDDLWIAPPVWSPDSSQLAYTRVAPSASVAADGPEAEAGITLWRMEISSGRQSEVGTPAGLEADLFYGESRPVLSWSDDGIAYRRYLADDRALVTTVNPVSGQVAAEVTVAVKPAEPEAGVLASAISLPCAVIHYSQNDPRWRSENMESCDLTIGSAGCALTSAAMILRYYNVNYDPSSLNTTLGSSACPLSWYLAAQASDGRATFTGTGNGWIDFSWTTVQENLQAGKPPILLLTKNDGDNTHFVVIVSGSGSDPAGYVINDSWDGVVKSLTAYTDNGWVVSSLRIYGGTPYCLSDECPQSGGVLLYKHENNDCGGEDVGTGYVLRTTAGWKNVPSGFNDEASSIVIPSGWSVRLYQDENRGGVSIGLAGSDASFDGDTFPGGLLLNDQVSSFEVYTTTACLAPITITAPVDGGWLGTATQPITVTTAGGGVAMVTFYRRAPGATSWIAIGSDSTATDGWGYSWSTTALTEGQGWALRAVASDGDGHQVSAEIIGLGVDHTAPTGSIRINSGGAVTSSRSVLLNLAASDSLSLVAAMQLRNDGGTWGEWEPYVATSAWQLPETAGSHTVGVRYRDAAGNISAEQSATITYPATHRIGLPMILRRD